MNATPFRAKMLGGAMAGLAIAVGASCGSQTGVPSGTSTADLTSTFTAATSSSPHPASSVVALPPNNHGYVRVETKSGLVRCSLNVELVACQTSADTWALGPDGQPFHCASVMSDGHFEWVKADLGALEGMVKMDYETYSAQGWTIDAAVDGTRFTNDRTGHGMSVSVETVQPF